MGIRNTPIMPVKFEDYSTDFEQEVCLFTNVDGIAVKLELRSTCGNIDYHRLDKGFSRLISHLKTGD